MICLYWMMYTDLSNTSIIVMAIIATTSLITTTTSGLIRAFIGHKMGLWRGGGSASADFMLDVYREYIIEV